MLFAIPIFSTSLGAAIFVLMLFAVLSVLIEGEEGAWSTAVVVVATLFLQLFSDLQPITYLFQNPGWSLVFAGAYLVLGTVWGAVRWISFAYKARDVYAQCRDEYMRTKSLVEEDLDEKLCRVIRQRAESKLSFELPLNISDHKERLVLWMAYWPISMVWTMLRDPVFRVFNFIYTQISATLQSVSVRAFSRYHQDFLK